MSAETAARLPAALSPPTAIRADRSQLAGILGTPSNHRVHVLGRRREPVLRSLALVDGHHRALRSDAQLATYRVVGVGITDDVPAAVEVHEQRARCR